MSKQNKVLPLLNKLSSCKLSSHNFYNTVEKLVLTAFKEPKPLFAAGAEKARAGELLVKSLEFLEKSVKILIRSLESDCRQFAQKVRSGLQFLIDEFLDLPEIHHQLKEIFDCPAIESLEEFIETNEGRELVYSSYIYPLSDQELGRIPKSHLPWWPEHGDKLGTYCTKQSKRALRKSSKSSSSSMGSV